LRKFILRGSLPGSPETPLTVQPGNSRIGAGIQDVTPARPGSSMTKKNMKSPAFAAGLSALTLMVGLAGCVLDSQSPATAPRIDGKRTTKPDNTQTTDQAIEDRRTAERVREALAAGTDYKYDGVKVIANHGVVHLSGLVNTRAQLKSAERIAAKVVGVKSVENNLTAKF
jgi:BON domain